MHACIIQYCADCDWTEEDRYGRLRQRCCQVKVELAQQLDCGAGHGGATDGDLHHLHGDKVSFKCRSSPIFSYEICKWFDI